MTCCVRATAKLKPLSHPKAYTVVLMLILMVLILMVLILKLISG
eukprot:CAMPEP_0119106814 /NCGR_PEP_ID=MMETSP1180-20130426/6337_1 /TAXON_ID=3052 ORGANISM="Chlamydomonas cf sp, Strain CCMP681" /NCGR_SAMPLE_ID=MMETSP1180 /ASSEMBLY_ACC=CAM_ASM_000741 /LENGTH=43 /DNA_ID= /DNA_START= /DNA_END= /DNA_ORIENTATION=